MPSTTIETKIPQNSDFQKLPCSSNFKIVGKEQNRSYRINLNSKGNLKSSEL